jgi:hypothetical protein
MRLRVQDQWEESLEARTDLSAEAIKNLAKEIATATSYPTREIRLEEEGTIGCIFGIALGNQKVSSFRVKLTDGSDDSEFERAGVVTVSWTLETFDAVFGKSVDRVGGPSVFGMLKLATRSIPGVAVYREFIAAYREGLAEQDQSVTVIK